VASPSSVITDRFDSFDTVLPPKVWREFKQRPARSKKPSSNLFLPLSIFAGAFLIALAIWTQPLTTVRKSVRSDNWFRTIAATTVPTPSPVVLTATPAALRVERAELIRLPMVPAPKAELTTGYEPNTISAMMPYGTLVFVTLKGRLTGINELPQFGNSIGDCYIVGSVPYVWITVPGGGAPSWVDP
jgi:hypothetical protein